MSAKDRLDEIDKAWKPGHTVKLMAALRAVLELHKTVTQAGDPYCCDSCGSFEDWPCPTVRAIEEALR